MEKGTFICAGLLFDVAFLRLSATINDIHLSRRARQIIPIRFWHTPFLSLLHSHGLSLFLSLCLCLCLCLCLSLSLCLGLSLPLPLSNFLVSLSLCIPDGLSLFLAYNLVWPTRSLSCSPSSTLPVFFSSHLSISSSLVLFYHNDVRPFLPLNLALSCLDTTCSLFLSLSYSLLFLSPSLPFLLVF